MVLVLVVLVTGGAATASATSVVRRGHERLAEQAMTQSMREAAGALADGVGAYEDALLDVATALGAGFAQLDARMFAHLANELSTDRLPGVTNVSFVAPAKDSQVAETQAYWRARGAIGLSLYRTQTEAKHQFVIFGRSFTPRPVTLGRDLSTTPATAEALTTAQDLWRFAMGPAHIAVRDRELPDSEQQISVTLAAPVLDGVSTFRGWVVMGVYAGEFLSATLSDRLGGRVNIKLTDVDPRAPQTIVRIAAGAPMNEPSLNRTQELYVGQRLWRLDLEPTATLLSAGDRQLGRFTPLVGVVFTLLLAVLVAVLASGRNRAMDRVDRATAALRRDIERRQEVEEQLRERERELREMAFHDQLTGLANRSMFYDRVADALGAHAASTSLFAVMFIDLDGFKEVNDQYGHSAGDLVLQATAERLKGCTRDTDTVARFGGDEFAVVLENLTGPDEACVAADRMVAALSAPIRVGASEATVTASVGIRLNRPGDDTDAILRAADLAMYQAKKSGKSRHVLAAV